MTKLLSITIPTYNRAEMLDEQLAWLAGEIKGYESECEIVIHDNCSTDNTFEIIQKWQLVLSKIVTFKHDCHHHNIGGMLNIVSCMEAATGSYVWTLGDDDRIKNGTLIYILKTLKQNPDLTVILLNGNGRDRITNEITVERWFDRANDQPSADSKSEFEYFLKRNLGGVMFISAAVYHTKLLNDALSSWQGSAKNLAAQAYWVAYCAGEGSFIVTSDLHTECAMAIGFTDKDPQWNLKMQFICIPEVFLKLMKIGYSKKLCYLMILKTLQYPYNWKFLLIGMSRWLFFTIKAFSLYLACVAFATWMFFVERDDKKITAV